MSPPLQNAVGLFFDKVAEEKIKAAWTTIAQLTGLPNQLGGMDHARPHISLGLFSAGQPQKILEALAELASTQAPFQVQFESIGMFDIPHGILFLGPVPTHALLAFHKKCHARIGGLAKDWQKFYLPEKLIFHCSLNIGLQEEDLLRAAKAALQVPLPIVARAESAGLLQPGNSLANQTFPFAD